MILLALTVGLWRASLVFLDFRIKESSAQNSRQAIERINSFLNNRLTALRQVSHFYAHSDNIQEREFQGFCAATLADVPGILAILATDKEGHPTWISPVNALSQSAVYVVTADPKLKMALARSLTTMEPALTESLDMPEKGAGFLAATPILVGNRHIGYIVGIFNYQGLLDYLLEPDLVSRYRLRITQGGWPIFPALAVSGFTTLISEPVSTTAYGMTQNIQLGGQEWVIALDPINVIGTSPTNFVSLTILGLGLILSLLLTYLVFRWQWQAILFQAQARESETRLERTGINLVEIKSEMDLIMNSVDEGIILYNEQLEPVQANAAFMLTFNMAEESKAMQSSHVHHEHMIQQIGSETKYWSLFNTLKQNPEQSYTDELEVQSKEAKGPVRVFLRRATAACGADGNPRGVLVIYKDMTKLKAMNRVKDEFLSNVTHELRSPLASIKGFAETIRRAIPRCPTSRAKNSSPSFARNPAAFMT